MDKQELQKLRDLPIEGVAEQLGLQVTRHKCLCPFHADNHPSLSFRVSKNTYRCFVCGASGGTIDLVMKYLRKDFREACQWLQNEQTTQTLPPAPPYMEGSGQTCNGIYSPPNREGSGESRFDASRYVRYFERPWLLPEARRFLFEERRLDERVVRWCRLTSWKDKQGVPWLQIPYYDREGKLVGVQNRNLVRGALPRFRFPQGSVCGIYNLPVLNLLKPGEQLFITEGCSDCWAMLSAGHKAIAIPSATLLTKKDKELLRSLEHFGDSPSEHSEHSEHFEHFGDSPSQYSEHSEHFGDSPSEHSEHSEHFEHFGDSPSVIRSATHSGDSPRATKLPSSREGLGVGPFHMFPDRDVPGERLFLQLKEVLPSLVHHQLPPDCKDFSDYYLKFIVHSA